MLVFFDTLDVALVAFVDSTGDSDVLVFFEFFFVEDFAAGGVGCRQEAEEFD